MSEDADRRPPPLFPFHPMWDGVSIPAAHWHFHRRLHEHYGIVLRPGEFSRIFRKAVVEKKKVVVRDGDRRIHAVYLHGAQEIIFVLASDTALITAFSPGAALRKRNRSIGKVLVR